MTGAELCERLFQSTPPARGGDLHRLCQRFSVGKISIHAPREGGDRCNAHRDIRHIGISIHAPREGGDPLPTGVGPAPRRFQSTPPARGGDSGIDNYISQLNISIHAPREGGDLSAAQGIFWIADFNPRPPRGGATHPQGQRRWYTSYFNPRPPRGGRQPTSFSTFAALAFQSTPPARGATAA